METRSYCSDSISARGRSTSSTRTRLTAKPTAKPSAARLPARPCRSHANQNAAMAKNVTNRNSTLTHKPRPRTTPAGNASLTTGRTPQHRVTKTTVRTIKNICSVW